MCSTNQFKSSILECCVASTVKTFRKRNVGKAKFYSWIPCNLSVNRSCFCLSVSLFGCLSVFSVCLSVRPSANPPVVRTTHSTIKFTWDKITSEWKLYMTMICEMWRAPNKCKICFRKTPYNLSYPNKFYCLWNWVAYFSDSNVSMTYIDYSGVRAGTGL